MAVWVHVLQKERKKEIKTLVRLGVGERTTYTTYPRLVRHRTVPYFQNTSPSNLRFVLTEMLTGKKPVLMLIIKCREVMKLQSSSVYMGNNLTLELNIVINNDILHQSVSKIKKKNFKFLHTINECLITYCDKQNICHRNS